MFHLIGIPADGATPFTMAILDMSGSVHAARDRAEHIYQTTAHLYVQKLSGYRVEWRPIESRKRQ